MYSLTILLDRMAYDTFPSMSKTHGTDHYAGQHACMVDTNWVDWQGTKHPTCSCGLINALVNVVVVDVQHNAALTIVTGGVQGEATTSNAHLLVAVFSLIVGSCCHCQFR